ncbi:MAG TPA: tetratricopeptide repeat protein [Candidatus Sulfotelmatobacter sp.]|nr:tetratricopeptide repeat protein [Candidatus Sulfotelmatobacter sp.]
MAEGSSSAPLYRFGPFELDPGQGILARNGNRIKLQDLPYRLLVMLVERHGEIVTRDEVRQHLWAGNTFVEFDNSLGVAIRKVRESLGDDADAPRYVETIPRRGYRFLAPVTRVEPGPTEVRTRPENTRQLKAPTTGPRWRREFWLVPVLVILLVGAVIYSFRSASRNPSTKAAAAEPPVHVRRSVAILGFRNLPGRTEDNWLSPAFSEMLNTELAGGGELRLVSGEDVARAKTELPLTDEDSLAKSTLQRLRIDPGADVVVVGSYISVPDKDDRRIRLDLRVQDTASGETIAEDSVTGEESDLFQMVAEASVRLRQSLGLSAIGAGGAAATRAALPSNPQAIRFYTEGRAHSWAFDFVGAKDLLLKAVDADPNYPLAHSALSEAWEHLGYVPKAKAEAERALELSEHLSQEDRLLVEGQYRDTLSDTSKAVEAYQELFNLFPDNLLYGLRLANTQRLAKPAAALKTLDKLRDLPAPAGDDPRIDLAEASTWIGQDFAKAHAAAERAITKGTIQGSHLLVARAYGVLCEQGVSANATADAVAACENARQSYAAAGDRNNEARTLSDFAGVYYQQGDLARAEAMWREAIPVFREVGDLQGLAATSNNLGDVFLLRGDLDKAKIYLQQAIPNYQAVDDKGGVALIFNDLGDVLRRKGELQAALTSYRQAKATSEEIDDSNAIAYILTGMGDVFSDQGDFAGARKSYEESLALRTKTGEKQAAAQSQTALAQLSIEEGRVGDAESLARSCLQQFHQEQQADDELAADTVLIDALTAQGKSSDAQKQADAAQALAEKSQNQIARLQLALALARLRLASGDVESSRKLLQQVSQSARERGLLGIELEAMLGFAQLARKTGSAASAQQQFASLERAARAKGFERIAAQAKSVRENVKQPI